MGKAQKVTKADKQPTLTQQIDALNERKGGIQTAIANIKTAQPTYQKRLDAAEETLVDALGDAAAEDTSEARDKASEARMVKMTVRNDFEQQLQDLKTLPNGIEKIDLQIQGLTGQKKGLEAELIADKLPNMDELKQKARIAIAELSAAWCMTTTRNTNFTGIREVCKRLDKDDSVSRLFVHKYAELESKMGFDKL